MRKSRYNGECRKADRMAVLGIVDGEISLKQLILFESQNIDLGW